MAKPTSSNSGNSVPAKIPLFNPAWESASPVEAAHCETTGSFWETSDTTPDSHGPSEPPRSPKIASMPNIAVPPRGNVREDRLNTPGHIKLTESPVSAQPSSEKIGHGENTVTR